MEISVAIKKVLDATILIDTRQLTHVSEAVQNEIYDYVCIAGLRCRLILNSHQDIEYAEVFHLRYY